MLIHPNKPLNMEKVNIIHIIVSENNPIIIDIRAAFLLEKMEKVNIGVIKDCSNATEGFLTEI